MKNIDIGTLFSVPLTVEGKDMFLYGYILYNGDFLLANIFDYHSETREIPDTIEIQPFLLRDFIIDWMLFKSFKNQPEHKAWIKSKKKISSLQGPLDPLFVLGSHTSQPLIFDIQTEAQRPALSDDAKDHQSVSVHSLGYYRVFLEAKVFGKNMVFDTNTKKYLIVD